MKNTIDAIVLMYSGNEDLCWYQSFLYGIEEESVPIRCINAEDAEDVNEYDALAMARVASKNSVFEIGVGVDHENIIVRHRLQKEDEYLFKVSRGEADEKIRIQGHNTARIIKKLPLFLDND